MIARLAVTFALSLVLIASPVDAADTSAANTTQAAAMSQPIYAGLQSAQELIEAQRYAEGHAILNKLRQQSELSNYEVAQIWNLTAYAYYLQDNFKNAIGAYSRVLKQLDLPAALVQSTLKTLSQLYFTTENYKGALATVNRLIKSLQEPSADIYMLQGQAYFQLEKYQRALAPIKSALALHRAQGHQIQENWLLLLRVCYYELHDFKNMLRVLKQLVQLFPNDRYVLTLAGVYSELGDTKKQLALLEALYEDGKLERPSHIINLANLYLVHGLPFKAASLLEREQQRDRVESNERNLRLLSQAWYQAREYDKAVTPLERAAKVSDDGELYVRLAQSYINLERWREAADAVSQGLRKGRVKRLDIANLMLGMALFNQRKMDAARRAFITAGKDPRSAKSARQWLSYVSSESSRDTTLEQTLPEHQQRNQDAILQNL